MILFLLRLYDDDIVSLLLLYDDIVIIVALLYCDHCCFMMILVSLLLYLDIVPSTLTAELYYPVSNGTMQRMDYNSPHTLQTADFFYFSGMYFLA